MADMQPQPPQQGVQQVNIISSGGSGSGNRPLQMMSNIADGGAGTRPTPIVLNASPVGVQIHSSSTPVKMQSTAGVQGSPSVGGSSQTPGGVVILSAGSTTGSPSAPPPQPAAVSAVPPGGITIRSTIGASAPQPSYNGPAMAQVPPSVVQPQPVAPTVSPAAQVVGVSPVAMTSGVIRVGSGAASPQHYGQPQPAQATLNQPVTVPVRPVTDQTTTRARSQGAAATAPATTDKPRLTPGELMSKADPLWVCGFILAVVAVSFATMAFEDDVSTTWLLLFVSAASVGAFVKLQL